MNRNRLAAVLATCAVLALAHCATNEDTVNPVPNGQTGGAPGVTGGAPGVTGGTPGVTGGTPGVTGGTPGVTGGTPGVTGGTPGVTGGTPGATGGMPSSGGDVPMGGDVNPGLETRKANYASLAVAPGEPFTDQNASQGGSPPPGWAWYEVEGTSCRDGSQNGVYLHRGTADKLIIFFEGGGACTTEGFCHFNPKNVDYILTGTGETVLGTAAAAGPGRQKPGVYSNGQVTGIFDTSNADNPFKDWSMVYIPYCTGDVHFGTNPSAMIEDVPNLIEAMPPQKMVGYENAKKFVARIKATFGGKITRGVVTGSSAGSFGAALNFSMIQDTFEGVPFSAILDSGAPFDDSVWPPCQQKRWRDLFGLNGALPADCAECFAANGGGLLGMADFLIDKHPLATIAIISTMEDQVIRLFLTPGNDNCATITTADPFELTLGQVAGAQLYSAADYTKGLNDLRSQYLSSGRMSTYYMNGDLHQHVFRPRFFEAAAGGVKMSKFVSDFLDGTMAQVGP